METRWNWDSAAGTNSWLHPGEHIFWRGQPDPRKIFSRGDLFLVPFSLLWGGFAIFWEVGVTRSGWNFGSVFGIPFVLVGLYLIFGRFLYKRWSRNRTRYCITGQRVLVSRQQGRQVQSIPLAEPLEVTRQRAGRCGTLLWRIPGWQPTRRTAWNWSNSSSPITATMAESGWPGANQMYGMLGFFDISDVDQALKQLQLARSTQSQS